MMNNREQQRMERLSARIMRRIYFVAGIRMMLHPVFLKTMIVLVFFWRSTASVSYGSVFANAPSVLDIGKNVQFFASAFHNTNIGTATLLVAMATLLVWVAMDIVQKRTHAWI